MSEEATDQQAAQDATSDNDKTEARPPWGSDEEFNPEKAWSLIQNLRSDLEKTKPAVHRLREIEDASKSELQKERERAEAAERRASLAEMAAIKTRIAAEENVPVEVLHGDSEDSIRAVAQRVRQWAETGKKPAPPVASLKSGSADKGDEGSRAVAALRALRQG